jgi:hypothetical protein
MARTKGTKLPGVPAGFHYDRSSRLGMASAPEPRGPRGWLRGNRAMKILLLDLLAVAVLLFIASRFLISDAVADRIGEYGARVEVATRQSATLVTIHLSNERLFGTSPERVVVARMTVPGASDALRVEKPLPRRPGAVVSLRALVSTPSTELDLFVRLTIDGKDSALVVPIGVATP